MELGKNGPGIREMLEGEKVRLRRVRSSDEAAMFEAIIESREHLRPWMWWCGDDYSRDRHREWIESRDRAWEEGADYSFVIEDVETDLLLGACGINRIEQLNRFANLGYWVRTSRTRRGVATAAAVLLARVGFEDLGLLRLEIVVAVGNRASQGVAAAAGAKREGVLRNRLQVQGGPFDAVMFSLVPGDLD